MEKQITVDDIINAKEIYLYNEDTLYIVDLAEEAYGFCKTGRDWFHKSNFWDYFDSSMMMSYFSVVTKEEAVALYKQWAGQEV